MEPDTYSVIIYWSADESCFVATAPDIPGCVERAETRENAVILIDIEIHNRLLMNKTGFKP